MKIYHGTTLKYLDAILENGITPRKRRKGNWKNAPSNSEMVYLSTAYPFYYARASSEDVSKCVVFEIETDRLDDNHFYPDEDFVFQAMRHTVENLQHKYIRDNLKFYQYMWEKSLEHFGGFCHDGVIPIKAITKYVTIDFILRKNLSFAIDPVISVMNYMIVGEKYNRMVQWFFGYRYILPDAEKDAVENQIINMDCETLPEDIKKMYDDTKKRIEFWEKESKDRSGIKIVELGE